jgi:transposase
LEQEFYEIVDGEIEVMESYFGGVRRGRRSRGAPGKVAAFEMDLAEFVCPLLKNHQKEGIVPAKKRGGYVLWKRKRSDTGTN